MEPNYNAGAIMRDMEPSERRRTMERGQNLLLSRIAQAPESIRKAIVADALFLRFRKFASPYQEWQAVAEVLQKHLPSAAMDARHIQFLSLFVNRCDDTA